MRCQAIERGDSPWKIRPALPFDSRTGQWERFSLTDCAPSKIGYESTTGETPYIYAPKTENCYHFFGTEASLAFPRMRKLFYSDPAKSGWNYPLSEEEITVVQGDDPYTREFRHFCGVILGKETPRTSGEDGRKTLEVTLAAGKSAETGTSITLSHKPG